ncbi:hypothetical protein MPH_09411 [Macrophomina phaseolina MS6]|uniref:Uncharacterized protein n=1 Tax=Macrophomina phaseolina (strain MS6) TaxID=1126212 RepID=K2S940_MACPH|nr:hypothetical protein MPH_09411 [Macrophomina phaseolina MS6]
MSQQGGSGQAGAPPVTGPPYAPRTWSLGGRMDESVDIPITSVFLALYIIGAIGHMVIFKKNMARGHKFILTILIFGFCMCRVVTCILRIASATRPTNVKLAIAAQIFVAAGVLLIYIINLVFAQRLIRAQHPRLGWSFRFGMFFKLTYIAVALTLIMVITVTVQSFYTLNTNTKRIDRDIQLYCSTFFAYVSFLPIPLTLLGLILPRKKRLEKFGTGRWRSKIFVLLLGSFIVCLGASFRCATAYLDPVPMAQPLPSYFSRACFYVFNFTLEILVIYLYLIVRIDKRFHIPNGAKGPGQYARGPYAPKVVDPKRTSPQSKKHDSMQSGIDKASTLNEYDPATPRTLNLKTDFSGSEKRKMDLEAQTEPQSAISGTTAALSKDHLLLPESPKPVYIKSEKHRSNADVPPVPALPPSATGALPHSTNTPLSSSGRASALTAEDKLDKVVELLVSLDRRLSSLEEGPRHDSSFDLLDRLNARLSRLEETDPGATPRMRPQSSAGTTLRGSVDNAGMSLGLGGDNPAISLLDRLDRRLSRLEEHEARLSRQNSGIDTMMMLDRRLSRIESRMGSPEPANSLRLSNSARPSPYQTSGAFDHDTMIMLNGGVPDMPLAPPSESRFDRWNYGNGGPVVAPPAPASPRLRGGASSPHHRFSQSPSRYAQVARTTWPLDEQPEERRQHQQQQRQQPHPPLLRPGFVHAPHSTDSIGTVTLNDEEDQQQQAGAPQHSYPATLAVGRAFTPDDDRPHRLSRGEDDVDMLTTGNALLAHSVSVSSAYSRATDERPRTAYVVEENHEEDERQERAQGPMQGPLEGDEFHSARGSARHSQ